MECAQRWARERGLDIEPYGLDLSPPLAALARRRLPAWADRIWVGNAIDWTPPRRFDFVRTGLEYVPAMRQRDLVARLLELSVDPGGRLVIGSFSEERDDLLPGPTVEQVVAGWGFAVAGRAERAHWHDERLRYKAFWLEG